MKKASEIIKQSCCGNLLSVDKAKLVKQVEDLEIENAFLKNQLKNAIAEIRRRR